ncbi:MAG: FAD-binding oxidoreductase, partial [Rhodospirillaceae bacterium]|nr:FAD-binding oxidoreductase [Rhodospirillaceae bacterium]
EADWFRHVAGFAPIIGFDMEIIDAAEIKRLFPYIETDGVVCGAHTTMDGHVDPAGCCNALATGARTMGASIQRHTRVTDINLLPSGAWAVRLHSNINKP